MHNTKASSLGVPDFLGIGAPRSGTTWLYHALRAHPRIWLPPLKELHYFDSVDPTVKEKYAVHRRSFRIRNYGLGRIKQYLAYPLRFSKQTNTSAEIDTAWDLRYFLGNGSVEWYQSLFREGKRQGLLTGEITPAYFTVSLNVVNQIRVLNPDIKLIMILRNPIERSWSSLAKFIKETESTIERIDDKVLLSKATSESHLKRSAYADNIERWQSVFNEGNLKICFFDDLKTDSVRFLEGVYRFLNVEAHFARNLGDLVRPVASASHLLGQMPFPIRYELCRLHEPQLRRLADVIGPPVTRWYAEACEILCQGAATRAAGS